MGVGGVGREIKSLPFTHSLTPVHSLSLSLSLSHSLSGGGWRHAGGWPGAGSAGGGQARRGRPWGGAPGPHLSLSLSLSRFDQSDAEVAPAPRRWPRHRAAGRRWPRRQRGAAAARGCCCCCVWEKPIMGFGFGFYNKPDPTRYIPNPFIK